MVPCDHENVTLPRAFDKLTARCGVCRRQKTWPSILMMKCRQCNDVWHPECFENVKLDESPRPVVSPQIAHEDSIERSASAVEAISRCAPGRFSGTTRRPRFDREMPRECRVVDSRHGQIPLVGILVSHSTKSRKEKKRVTFDVPESSRRRPTIGKYCNDVTDNNVREPKNNNKQNKRKLQNRLEKRSLTRTIKNLQREIDEKRVIINNMKITLKQLNVPNNQFTTVREIELGMRVDAERTIMTDLIATIKTHRSRLSGMTMDDCQPIGENEQELAAHDGGKRGGAIVARGIPDLRPDQVPGAGQVQAPVVGRARRRGRSRRTAAVVASAGRLQDAN